MIVHKNLFYILGITRKEDVEGFKHKVVMSRWGN